MQSYDLRLPERFFCISMKLRSEPRSDCTLHFAPSLYLLFVGMINVVDLKIICWYSVQRYLVYIHDY
jgi:hypothetical protein